MLKREATPLYHQLKELLTDKIESGEWAPGHLLPSETELMREFGVSRATVRQAAQMLENQGLIERRQGKGSFVGRPKLANNLMMLFSPMKGMTGTDTIPRLELDYVRVIPSPRSVAAHLCLGANEKVYELKRRVVVDGEPILIIRNWLPVARFEGLDTGVFADPEATVRGVLLSQYGVDRVRQHKEVEVTILDEQEARDLSARVGAPALLVTYLTCLPSGTPIEYRKLVVRGDRCRYYVDQDGPEFLV